MIVTRRVCRCKLLTMVGLPGSVVVPTFAAGVLWLVIAKVAIVSNVLVVLVLLPNSVFA